MKSPYGKKFIVITSIRKPTDQLIQLCKDCPDWTVVWVDDVKTPDICDQVCGGKLKNFIHLDVQDQEGMYGENLSPYNHYARKNYGYLEAIKEGASCILDLDDDNFSTDYLRSIDRFLKHPYPNKEYFVRECSDSKSLINPFSDWIDEYCIGIYPRGIPAKYIEVAVSMITGIRSCNGNKKLGIVQSIVTGEADVDAMYRLTHTKGCEMDIVTLKSFRDILAISKVSLAPYNSQSTLHFKPCFKYLFIPPVPRSMMRMCDIVRAYVTQACMATTPYHLGYGYFNIRQERNPHNILEDLKSEMPFMMNGHHLVDMVLDIVKRKEKVSLSEMYHKILCDSTLAPLFCDVPVGGYDPLNRSISSWNTTLKKVGVKV